MSEGTRAMRTTCARRTAASTAAARSTTRRSRRNRPLAMATLALLLGAGLLAGCGDKKANAATQAAARVNRDEITVHQINFVLAQQRGVRPEQAQAAGKQVLERLIDQQLTLEKADELKIDRDPRVLQAIEAAKREVISRAYLERVADGAPKPTAQEVQAYYDSKPALFKDRKVYNLQELAIEAKPEQIEGLRAQLAQAPNIAAFVETLKAQDFRFGGNQAVRTAEQLPLQHLDAIAALKDGQALALPATNGLQVVVVLGSRSQPVAAEQARPAVEQFLLNERKRKLMEDDVKSLRAAAKIQYMGAYADGAAAAATAAPVNPAPATTPATEAATPAPASSAQPNTGATAASASAPLGGGNISKGLGLK